MTFLDSKYQTQTFDRDTQNALTRSLAGTRARVEEKDGKIYVVIDGIRVEADRNDLFGMNKANPNEWLEKLIAQYDEQMAKNDEKIGFLEKAEESIKLALKKVRQSIHGILSKCGVSSIDKIGDESLRTEAISLNSEKWSLTFEKTSIGNQIRSTLLSSFLAACDKGSLSSQVAVNHAMMERYA